MVTSPAPTTGPGNLGVGGERLFDWYSDGDTPSQRYPSFRLSAKSAAFFDDFAGRFGSVITGRRTYDITSGWNGKGPLPGVPLSIMTHQPPDNVPDADPPYTFITSGIGDAVAQARSAAGDKDGATAPSVGEVRDLAG